jgi:hypothetical protein
MVERDQPPQKENGEPLGGIWAGREGLERRSSAGDAAIGREASDGTGLSLSL